MFRRLTSNQYGFTLVEILVVIIIVGMLAAIAIPRISSAKEIQVKSEGMQILMTVLGAQKIYFLEYGTYTNNTANLDVDVSGSQYFAMTLPAAPSAANVGIVTRATGTYGMSISATGVITCDDTSAGYTAGTCDIVQCKKGGGNQCN